VAAGAVRACLVAAYLLWASPVTAGDDAAVLAHLLRAVERREVGDLDGAAEALEAAHALVPDDPDLTLELAHAYAAARRYGAAAAAHAEASAIAPARADLALARARFHLDRSFRVRAAAEAAERAAQLRPDDAATIALLDRARAAAALAEVTDRGPR
jgi:tetratricopeptide (TPR) repeat protein